MSKSEQIAAEIRAYLQIKPNGAGLEEITLALSAPPPRRSLQRILALLVAHKRLVRMGNRRGTRYFAPLPLYQQNIPEPQLWRVEEPALEQDLVISIEGEDIRRYVRQPLAMRRTVGYQPDFLRSYQPNQTYYLPESLRQHLHSLGRTEGERPAGTYAREILQRLLIDLAWNSSRLEGNTYSLLETEELLMSEEPIKGKTWLETQMILNHKAAIEFLVEEVAEIGFNSYTILNLHTLLAENLLQNRSAWGRLRMIPVGIAEHFERILSLAEAIQDPYEQAFFAMVQFPYLQAFEDVNKRVSRLAANIPLIKNNLAPLSFVSVPESTYIEGLLGVYELNRIELLRDVFVWAYECSAASYVQVRATLGQPDLLRLRYRILIAHTLRDIIIKKLSKKAVPTFIRKLAEEQVPAKDRSYFIGLIELELVSLHEGSLASYKIKPVEFEAWLECW